MSRGDAWCLVGLAAAYAGSREALHGLGIRFDSTQIQLLWQVLPVELLQHDLWSSLWHLHAQPPLYNLMLGLAFRLQDWPDDVLRAAFAMTAVSLLMMVVVLLRAWGVSRPTALAVAAAIGMNPSFIGYEHWPFYTVFEAWLLLAATLAVTRWARASGAAAAVWPAVYALTVTALMMTRALFHPAWAAVAGGAVLWRLGRLRTLRRAELAWTALPCVAGLALMTHNAILVGQFATSSWMGMNTAHVVFTAMPPEDAAALEARGRISPLHRVGGFAPLEQYAPYAALVQAAVPRRVPTGVPALDLPRKAVGQSNFNHLWYAGVSRVLQADVMAVLVERPGIVVSGWERALAQFVKPASEYGGIARTVSRVSGLERAYLAVCYPSGSTALVGFWLAAAIAFSATAVWRRRVGDARAAGPAGPEAAFLAITLVWVTAAGTLGEFGENNRFRFAIDPLTVAIVVASVASMGRRSAGDVARPA